MSSGTWQVMRRELDRTLLVVVCATKIEAEAARRATLREHPNEDVWIERNGGTEVTETETIPYETPIQRTPTRIPEARVVSQLAGAEPRDVPWSAVVYVIGPTTSWVATVLLAGAVLCMPFAHEYKHAHLFSDHVEHMLTGVGIVWMVLAFLVLAVGFFRQQTFLRRAHVIHGVMTNGKIEVTVEGVEQKLVSIVHAIPEGARVPLFWDDSRLVELSKAGARISASGEMCWDVKPYPYRAGSWWPGAFLAASVVAVIVLIVTLVVALL